MRTTDHVLEVPLDHDRPAGPTITFFAREVAEHGGGHRPYLVFLQGGPGSESPRPSPVDSPAWLKRALRDYRLLLVDQRGTGRSSPVGRPETVPGETDEEKAGYLAHFRADAIVRDCELLRDHLGVERWSVLGQSFGGFTSFSYLSTAPQALATVYATGGIPPVGVPLEEVYAATYATMQSKSERCYARFPGDRDRMRAALDLARAGELRLPDGGALTPGLLRSIGGVLGRDGGELALHHLLELDPTSPAFSHDVAELLPFRGRNPIYSLLQEACYADGFVTRWAASRSRPAAYDEDETLLTGEHLAPWHFEETPELAPYAGLAEQLAGQEWPRLYDETALQQADVPVAAAVYYDDAFVDRDLSLRTASLLPRVHTWITNEYEHSGLRTSGERVLDRLINLARDL
jgi:pimeloyl-ACP methyl ester carboxylesterase